MFICLLYSLGYGDLSSYGHPTIMTPSKGGRGRRGREGGRGEGGGGREGGRGRGGGEGGTKHVKWLCCDWCVIGLVFI